MRNSNVSDDSFCCVSDESRSIHAEQIGRDVDWGWPCHYLRDENQMIPLAYAKPPFNTVVISVPHCVTSPALEQRSIVSASLWTCLTNCPVPNFTKFPVHVACAHGSVLLWQRCDSSCTSGFVDDLVFSRNSPWGTSCRERGEDSVTANALISTRVCLYCGLCITGKVSYQRLPC